ncbi:hypothetical protein An08g03050 [Aspergillus niger]|uniref:Uncharacterized protein n=2 Tax=Aspergillus niger TaxID=5061 RepID=A2QQM6_ASPNC|nr:hypothetical protein An08g03050 [Aspergillus niger]CAK45342.1 hypothetical protein An08g03050 [Aspergillus niger]
MGSPSHGTQASVAQMTFRSMPGRDAKDACLHDHRASDWSYGATKVTLQR